MTFCNRTDEFRQCVKEYASKVPDSKRRKADVSRRAGQLEEDVFARQYLTEAYTIILQFEQENAALLRSVEDTLASVKVAESRLLDISALQTELVAHLTRQTEVIDQLYDEAIASQGDVKRANVQLKKARENQADSRIFLIVFLLGASAALLFIHWYN
ncbi:hypothetical protein FRC06_002294 [Ceratobasidium sp. 370]|nr:hypothetical protein FRC06_002294 [Ceratobasidium sp. 370]